MRLVKSRGCINAGSTSCAAPILCPIPTIGNGMSLRNVSNMRNRP